MKNTTVEKIKNEILPLLPKDVTRIVDKVKDEKLAEISEMKLRVGKEVNLKIGSFEKALSQFVENKNEIYLVTREDINKTIGFMCRNSLYSANEEIKNGFITIKGGHRIGISGRTVMENEVIKSIKDFSGINIRVSREVTGSADELIKYVYDKKKFLNTLIISPPCCGKTTLLRDLVRQISNGIPQKGIMGKTISLIDERSELAACFNGEAQNDVGVRTDVLDCCPKSQGIMTMIRAMGPEIVAVDEIGSKKDAEAIMCASVCGVSILATMHGSELDDAEKREELQRLFKQKLFQRIVILSGRKGPGTIEKIIDFEEKRNVYEKELIMEVV